MLAEQARRGAEIARRAHNSEVDGLNPSGATNSRGYSAIGLDRPKDAANLGGVLRAAGVYGAALVMLSGGRMGKRALCGKLFTPGFADTLANRKAVNVLWRGTHLLTDPFLLRYSLPSHVV